MHPTSSPPANIPDIFISEQLGTLRPLIASCLKKAGKKRIRYAAVSVSEVCDRIALSGSATGKCERWSFINGNVAYVTPARLRTFKNSVKCVCCGREGNVFLLERHVNEPPGQYVNLYSADESGSLVLMTVDHILPNSIGGKYSLSNFQTMCSPCNADKQNSMPVHDIQRVLSNVDAHAKHWVNRDLLSALLRAQLMCHTTTGSVRNTFWKLYVKYSTAVRAETHSSIQARTARILNCELEVWTHVALRHNWAIIAYAKAKRWFTVRFPLKHVA